MKNVAGAVAVALCVLLVAEALAAGQNKLTQQASGQKTTLSSTQDISESLSKELEPLLDELQAAANAHDTDRFMALYIKGEGWWRCSTARRFAGGTICTRSS